MEKRKRNRDATTQRIVEALEYLLEEEGLDGVSVNHIAQKANVSKVLIYRYFGSIEGILKYYIRLGRLVPHYTPAFLDQIQPVRSIDLAPVWSKQTLQVFRQLRASRPARALLKATVKDNDSLADMVSQTLDAELSQLVQQLTFVKGSDHQAASAIILGALSYLTIQAQNDRTVIGIDLRSEVGWTRIEAAVKLIYKAIAQQAVASPTIQLVLKQSPDIATEW